MAVKDETGVFVPSDRKPAAPCDCIAYLAPEIQDAAGPYLDAYEEVRWNGEAWVVKDEMLGFPFLWVEAKYWPCALPGV